MAPRNSWIGLAGLLLAEAMNLLDSTVTTVAAPVIRDQLHGTASSVQWIAAAYTLPFSIALIPGGRLGDIHGRRRIFLAGLTVFVCASIGCACAPGMPPMLACRAVQGIAAGMIIPQTIGLVKAMFTSGEVGKALSFIGPVMGLTAVAGPMVGGFLTHADVMNLSWRAVFLVNVPLAVLTLIAVRLVPENRADRRPSLDILGIVLAACATAGVVVATISSSLGPAPKIGLLLAAAGAGCALVRHIRRSGRASRDPLVEPSLFRDRSFPAALATSAMYFGGSTGLIFVVVLYVQDGLGRSVATASLVVLPFSAGLAFASLLAGRWLLPRVGSRLMLFGIGFLGVGAALGSVAVAWDPATADATISAWLPVALGIAGFGGGLVTVPFFTAAISRLRPHEIGSAAGLLNSVQQLGGTLGVSVLGAFYTRSSTPGDGLLMTMLATLVVAAALFASTRMMTRSKI